MRAIMAEQKLRVFPDLDLFFRRRASGSGHPVRAPCAPPVRLRPGVRAAQGRRRDGARGKAA